MNDPTDFYLGIGIVLVLVSSCLVFVGGRLLCPYTGGFDESYIEAANDPV